MVTTVSLETAEILESNEIKNCSSLPEILALFPYHL